MILTFDSDSGVFTLYVAQSMIRTPAGDSLRLAPDALQWYRDQFALLATTDSLANALFTARAPAPPCNPRVQTCGPADPLGMPGDSRPEVSANGTPVDSDVEMDLASTPDMSCRDISQAMLDVMPVYRAAAAYHKRSLKVLTGALLANAARIKYDPETGLQLPQEDGPVSLGDIFGKYAGWAAVANYELAASNYGYLKTRLGVLGTFFNLHDCLNSQWDPVPNLPSPPGGGGGSGPGPSGGGGGLRCYFRVTSIDGVVVSRTFWYCRPI